MVTNTSWSLVFSLRDKQARPRALVGEGREALALRIFCEARKPTASARNQGSRVPGTGILRVIVAVARNMPKAACHTQLAGTLQGRLPAT